MQRVKVDLSIERKMVTLMVMSTDFITKLRPIVDPKLMKTPYAEKVVSWCIEYYDRYSEAPKQAIQDIFITKREKIKEDEILTSIGEFLSSLAQEYNEKDYNNLQYYIDASEKYLRTNSIEQMGEKLKETITLGDVARAEQLIANYKRIGVPATQGISIITDTSSIKDAFNEEQEVAFRLPGDLGKVCGNFYRGDLVGIIAGMKQGKSYALNYIAEHAMLCGNNVLFVSLEMRTNQLIRRSWQSLTGSPRFDCEVDIPKFTNDKEPDELESSAKCGIVNNKVFKKAVDLTSIEEYQQRLKTISRGGNIRFMCLPSKTTTVADIEIVIDNLMYYDNYPIDTLVIDYADILGQSKTLKSNEYRHVIDDIWSNLRRVAQERNISIITASQTNRGGLDGEELESKDIAEDIRKAAHVSKLIGLSRSKKDRERNSAKINVLFERDEQETLDSCVILQQYKIGRFCIDSRLRKEVED